MLAAVTAKSRSTVSILACGLRDGGGVALHSRKKLERLQALQTPSGDKNEKLQPVLLGKSLGLIQYKEKAQKHFTRDPCPAAQA